MFFQDRLIYKLNGIYLNLLYFELFKEFRRKKKIYILFRKIAAQGEITHQNMFVLGKKKKTYFHTHIHTQTPLPNLKGEIK